MGTVHNSFKNCSQTYTADELMAAACQLDAGAKIYAYRVDAVHKDVMKLVETCMFAERDPNSKKSKIDDEDDSTEEGIPGTSSNAEKQKKKKTKKKVIATADQITRKPKEKDPREMFVKMEAIPGNILNKAKHDSKDLSLTLDRHVPFWNNMQQYTPTKATGTCSIPDITVQMRSLPSYPLTGSEIDKQTASALKKTYDQKLKQSRQEANAIYVHQADNKSKAIWNTINNERQRKTEPETTKLEIHHDTGLLTDTGKIANCFTKYFSDIAEETLKANNINSNPVSTTSLVQSAPRENLTTADEMSRV
ncbi:hypothetical protein J6590_022995 [Homalodisca vitripennis]|nr:hypothetical protein J6590_022995 [Homalodisca vitripennis]